MSFDHKNLFLRLIFRQKNFDISQEFFIWENMYSTVPQKFLTKIGNDKRSNVFTSFPDRFNLSWVLEIPSWFLSRLS